MIAHTIIQETGKDAECLDGLALARLSRLGDHINQRTFTFNLKGKPLLVSVDLYNQYFPLEIKYYHRASGVYPVVCGRMAVYLQRRSLFVTSTLRDEIRKFDPPRGIRLWGTCRRVLTPEDDQFILSANLPQTVFQS